MIIVKKRQGFATNSSSVHSIIMTGEKITQLHEDEYWGNFVITTENNKRDYLWAQFARELKFDNDTKEAMIRGLYPDFVFRQIEGECQFSIPYDISTQQASIKFWSKLVDYIATDAQASIMGYHDGCCDYDEDPLTHPWDEVRKFLIEAKYYQGVLVKEYDDNRFALKSKKKGDILVVDFLNRTEEIRPTTPDLLDVKITDKCFANCGFCYQNSTPEGEHSSVDDIEMLLYQSYGSVFEVALGGGEPTLHPDFLRIIKAGHEKNIQMNFATRSLDWLDDKVLLHAVNKYCGAVAFSVGTSEEVINICSRFKKLDVQLCFHYILDLYSLENFKEIVKVVNDYSYNANLTLLGFKECGRAGERPNINDGWLDWLNEYRHREDIYLSIKVGIDTQMVKHYKEEIDRNKISSKLYHTREGYTSMYFDMVKKTCAASSFENVQHSFRHDQDPQFSWAPDMKELDVCFEMIKEEVK